MRDIVLAKQRGVYKRRQKALTPERADELVGRRFGTKVSKALLSRDYSIGRETVYRFLRGQPCRSRSPARAFSVP